MLLSEIPSTHPHKAGIEARLRRLLTTLGGAWSAAIFVEEGGDWELCLRQAKDGKLARVWTTSFTSHEQRPEMLEAWLHSLARVCEEELGLVVGYRAAIELTARLRMDLNGLTLLHRGGITRDGYIVLPEDERETFVSATQAAGIPLEVGLWQKGTRRAFAPPARPIDS